ncbi:MAG: hypothetical protein LWY06_06395 [Firmicutes bacterium]|nr:hypothetical protein [Bacillota bacterium]
MYYSNDNHENKSGNGELMMFPGIPRTSSVNLYPENCNKSEIGKVFDYNLNGILNGLFESPVRTSEEESFLKSLLQFQRVKKHAETAAEKEAIRRIEDAVVFRLRSVNKPITLVPNRRESNFAIGYLCGNKVIRKNYNMTPNAVSGSPVGEVYCRMAEKAGLN